MSDLEATETDSGRLMLRLVEKLEGIQKEYMQIYSGTNQIYNQQIKALEDNYNAKVKVLEKWREERRVFARAERETNTALLQSECDRHKRDIPRLREGSIRQQVEQLRADFPEVFGYFVNGAIPFIQEFAHVEASRLFTVDVEPRSPQIGVDEMRDMDETARAKPAVTIGHDRVITATGDRFTVGDDAVLAIGKMTPFPVRIAAVENDAIEFRTVRTGRPLKIALEALLMRVVVIMTA